MKKIYNILIIFFAFVTSVFAESSTATNRNVESFMESISVQSQRILNNNKMSEKQKEAEYKKFAEDIVDSDWVARFILGTHWKQLDETQRTEFQLLYKEYLLENYMPKLKDYNKELQINRIAKQKDNIYMVYATTRDTNDRTINVNFRIIAKNGRFYITDIIPEGISFISSQRSDVNSAISQNGYEKFVKQLKMKINK